MLESGFDPFGGLLPPPPAALPNAGFDAGVDCLSLPLLPNGEAFSPAGFVPNAGLGAGVDCFSLPVLPPKGDAFSPVVAAVVAGAEVEEDEVAGVLPCAGFVPNAGGFEAPPL